MGLKRKLLITAGALVVLGVVTVFAVRKAAGPWLLSNIGEDIREKYGLEVQIDDLSLALTTGDAKAKGVRFLDNGKLVLEIEEVDASINLKTVLEGTYDFKRLLIVRPVFHAVVEEDSRLNLRRIWQDRKQKSGPSDVVLLRDAQVIGGKLVLDDPVSDPTKPSNYVLEGIQASAADLQISGPRHWKLLGDLRIDAILDQKDVPARIAIVAWGEPLTEKPTFVLHAAVTALDLKQLPQYVDATDRWMLGGDVLHLVVTMACDEGMAEGAIVGQVAETGTTIPMKFAGPIEEPVFDEDSKLAATFDLPFAKLGRVGEVSFGAGWSIVKSGAGAVQRLGEGMIGAGSAVVTGVSDSAVSLVALDPLGALSAAGQGVLGTAEAIGNAIVGGVEDVVGGGSSAASGLAGLGKPAGDLQLEFRELHMKRRRALLDAALASARGGPKERLARIEKDLASSPD